MCALRVKLFIELYRLFNALSTLGENVSRICPAVPYVDDSELSSDDDVFYVGSVVSLRCGAGYYFMDGDITKNQTCTAQGWTPQYTDFTCGSKAIDFH